MRDHVKVKFSGSTPFVRRTHSLKESYEATVDSRSNRFKRNKIIIKVKYFRKDQITVESNTDVHIWIILDLSFFFQQGVIRFLCTQIHSSRSVQLHSLILILIFQIQTKIGNTNTYLIQMTNFCSSFFS